MMGLWIQTNLFLAYLILIFLIARIQHSLLYKNGLTSYQINPESLSVPHLKQILHNRGIICTGCFEKNDLIKFVKDSGDVGIDEVVEIPSTNYNSSQLNKPLYFNFKEIVDFYDYLQDIEKVVWLIYVVPVQNYEQQSLNDIKWKSINDHVAPLAIRTRVFHCLFNRNTCKKERFEEPTLLLILPGIGSKNLTVTRKKFHSTRLQSIFQWIHNELSFRVKIIKNIKQLEEHWLPTSEYSVSDIRVMLLTSMTHPPLFFSSLSARFDDRVIKFGIYTIDEDYSKTLIEKIKIIDHVPSYIIITKNKAVVYGNERSQRFNVPSMYSYLKFFDPGLDDFFALSFTITNMLVVLKIFQLSSINSWSQTTTFIVTTIIKYNLMMLIFFIFAISCNDCRFTELISELSTKFLRQFAMTSIGIRMISDYQFFFSKPLLFFSSFLVYSYMITRILKKYGYIQQVRSAENVINWFEHFQPMRFRIMENGEREQRAIRAQLDNIMSELIQSTDSSDSKYYINKLPTWIYESEEEKEMNAIKNLMDGIDEDKFEDQCESIKKRCHCGFRHEGILNFCGKCKNFKHQKLYNMSSQKCSICLDLYTVGNELCGLPCRHVFHKRCVVTWLEGYGSKCPVCRTPANKNL